MKSKANLYAGFTPTAVSTIDRVDPLTITPEMFFEQYVALRKPCILTSHHLGPTNATANWKSIDYLKAHAGTALVQTETKNHGQFGSSVKRTTQPFSQFLDALIHGSETSYLTTQYTTDPNPFQEYLHSPLTHLQSDYPKRPEILSNLVPQQVNLWLGASRQGTSSGLHHDFADNLYLLLSGTKRFTLFAPSDIPKMYLHGEVKRVCANGMVIYKGSDVRSDGAYKGDVLAYQTRVCEAELERCEREGNTEAIQYAADAVEEAMEHQLDYDMRQSPRKDEPQHQTGPLSFSKITTAELEQGSDAYPLLNQATRIVFEVREGEMLYLPAGWMHEVTSFSGGEAFHLAMNYWFHPPTTGVFEKPYEDRFWLDQWEETLKTLASTDYSTQEITARGDQEITAMTESPATAPLDIKSEGARIWLSTSGAWIVRDQK